VYVYCIEGVWRCRSGFKRHVTACLGVKGFGVISQVSRAIYRFLRVMLPTVMPALALFDLAWVAGAVGISPDFTVGPVPCPAVHDPIS
jgi:hypothetical protein